MLFVSQKYTHRHKILGTLNWKLDEGYSPSAMLNEIALTLSSLSNKSGLTEKEIIRQIDYLNLEGEIDITELDYTSYYLILDKGTAAYNDDKYLQLGWKNFLDNTYDIVKIISAIVLLIIATSTFILNIIDTKHNKKEIQELRNDVRNIKDSLNKRS